METLEVGEVVTLRVRFLDENGDAANPTVITLVHTDPSGNATTVLQAALTNPEVGVWTYDLTVDEAGIWVYRFEGTGAVVAGETGRVLVLAEGASPGLGPCEAWADADDVFECAPCADVAAADRDWGSAATAVEAASALLFKLTQFRYPGYCIETIRPTCAKHGTGVSCTCGTIDDYVLPNRPVVAVTQVRQDGTTLVKNTDYRLDDRGTLARIDGDRWPASQRLDLAATEDETWEITYVWGRTPSADGIAAVKRLACEFYLACSDEDRCTLPKQIQSLVRQGIEIGFEDISTAFTEGRVGIREVDWFLESERYGIANRPAVIVNPDTLPTARRTATA